MLNFSRPVLYRNTWGLHINSARYLDTPPEYPDWLNPLQKQEWQDRGLVVWDSISRVVTHLYAGYAIRILENMRETDTWKTNSFIIGSPAYQIPLPNTRRKKQTEETSIESSKGGLVITNKIELYPEQAKELLDFLTSEEDTLKKIATDEDREAREALRKVFGLIAQYGRKIREGKEKGKREVPPQKIIIPTAIPKGKYFTIRQLVEICNSTEKRVEIWIQTGDLDAIDLPGLGKIVEAGKLNKFFSKQGKPII